MGTQIALAIDSGAVPASLVRVYDRSREAAESLASRLGTRPEIAANAHLLSSGPLDMVVEAASQDAVRDVALSVLQNRCDMMVMSAGALLDGDVFEVLSDACADYGRSIYLPSGAVGGIDALRAVRGELESVLITTTKHPDSLPGAAGAGDGPATVFEGPAREAVRLFPANINVAAILSIAGIGADRTSVRIIADPAADRNTHLVEASGGFGSMSFSLGNVPDPANPRTSRLAALSCIEALRGYCTGGIRAGT